MKYAPDGASLLLIGYFIYFFFLCINANKTIAKDILNKSNFRYFDDFKAVAANATLAPSF